MDVITQNKVKAVFHVKRLSDPRLAIQSAREFTLPDSCLVALKEEDEH